MKTAWMVLRCGLAVLLCVALTPFCVLADEGSAVSDPVFGEINDKAAEDITDQEETEEEGRAGENEMDENQDEPHQSETCGAYAGNDLSLEEPDEISNGGSFWVGEEETRELQEGDATEEAGLTTALAIAEDGSADEESRLYPESFLARKGQLTEVPDGWIGIYTAEDLINVKGSNNYILMRDIDLSTYGNWKGGSYSGVFDGNGHVVSNLTIDTASLEETSSIGLFASVSYGGGIKNLGLKDISIVVSSQHSTSYVGSFVGKCDTALFGNTPGLDNCFASGEIIYRGSALRSYVGGLAGYMAASGKDAMENCYSSVQITMAPSLKEQTNFDSYCGGLVGELGCSTYDSGIIRCLNLGDITVEGNRLVNAGGIVGHAASGFYQGNRIRECLNVGTIRSNYRAGGIVGMWGGNSDISNCENIGKVEVEGAADKVYAAGIATLDSLHSAMSYCLSRGAVSSYASSGIAYAMPLIADLYGHDGRNNYYCSECAVIGEEVRNYKGAALSASQMRQQELFEGFDFENVWKMGREYPMLRFLPDNFVRMVEEKNPPISSISGEVTKLAAADYCDMMYSCSAPQHSDSALRQFSGGSLDADMLQMMNGYFAINAPNEKIYDNDNSPTYLQLYEAALSGWCFSGNSTYSGSMILEKDGKCMLVFASTRANRFGFKGDFIQNAALTYLNKSDLFANHLAEALLVTKACVKKYGKSNVCVVGAYSGGMLAQYVSAMTGVEGTAFNSGTAGYKLAFANHPYDLDCFRGIDKLTCTTYFSDKAYESATKGFKAVQKELYDYAGFPSVEVASNQRMTEEDDIHNLLKIDRFGRFVLEPIKMVNRPVSIHTYSTNSPQDIFKGMTSIFNGDPFGVVFVFKGFSDNYIGTSDSDVIEDKRSFLADAVHKTVYAGGTLRGADFGPYGSEWNDVFVAGSGKSYFEGGMGRDTYVVDGSLDSEVYIDDITSFGLNSLLELKKFIKVAGGFEDAAKTIVDPEADFPVFEAVEELVKADCSSLVDLVKGERADRIVIKHCPLDEMRITVVEARTTIFAGNAKVFISNGRLFSKSNNEPVGSFVVVDEEGEKSSLEGLSAGQTWSARSAVSVQMADATESISGNEGEEQRITEISFSKNCDIMFYGKDGGIVGSYHSGSGDMQGDEFAVHDHGSHTESENLRVYVSAGIAKVTASGSLQNMDVSARTVDVGLGKVFVVDATKPLSLAEGFSLDVLLSGSLPALQLNDVGADSPKEVETTQMQFVDEDTIAPEQENPEEKNPDDQKPGGETGGGNGGGNEPGYEEGQKPGGGGNGGSALEPGMTESGAGDNSLEGPGAPTHDNVAYSNNERVGDRSEGDDVSQEDDARGAQLAQTGDSAMTVAATSAILALASLVVLGRCRRRNLGHHAG